MSLYNKKTLALIDCEVQKIPGLAEAIAGVADGFPVAAFYSCDPFYGNLKMVIPIYYKAISREGEPQDYVRIRVNVIKNRSSRSSKNWYTHTVEKINHANGASLILKQAFRPGPITQMVGGRMWYFPIVDYLTVCIRDDVDVGACAVGLSCVVKERLGESVPADDLFRSVIDKKELWKADKYANELLGKFVSPDSFMLRDITIPRDEVWVCFTEDIMLTVKSVAHINPMDHSDVTNLIRVSNFKVSTFITGTTTAKAKEGICKRALLTFDNTTVPWLANYESEK